MSGPNSETRFKAQGSRRKVQESGLAAERSGRSISRGNRAAHPLRARILHRLPVASKGFTLFELIIVITLIVFLMALFMDRFTYYQEQAQKAAMEQVSGAIQSALVMQYGQIMTRGKPSDVAALAQDNPMNWLQKIPRNYSGEFYDPTPRAVAPGNWMFDLKSRDLIYVLGESKYFKPGKDSRKWIRFHVVLSYTASRLPSLQDKPADLTGLLFEPVEPYSWF